MRPYTGVSSPRAKYLALCLFVLSCGRAAAEQKPYQGPDNAALDAAQVWLWSNPPDAANQDARRERMAVIQAAADEFPGSDMRSYVMNWIVAPPLADNMEKQGILYALRQATDRAVADILRTKVTHGLVVWHLYNMGYVFKTPESCFAIDVFIRDARRLEPALDFLLVTHEHMDHHGGGLMEAMTRAGKPVIARFGRGCTIPEGPGEYTFGPVRVKVDIGDHSKRQILSNNMLMYQVDCGPAAGNVVIYHSGDGANIDKMTPDKPVDIYIPHVACSGMDVAVAIQHIDAKRTLVSHVLELTHEGGGSRWTYDYAFDRIRSFTPDKATVLTWAERWTLPGTEIETPANP